MVELPVKLKRAITRYEPIEVEGLKFYPITMDEYEYFLIASKSIDFLQQSLPVTLLSVPLLSAYWQMDIQNAEEGKPVDGKFSRALLFLAMALKILPEEEPVDRIREFRIETDTKDRKKLKAVIFQGEDGETKRLTPVQFQRLRPILAEQNGIKLESDTANPELVQAEKDIAEQNAPHLTMRLEDMISTVAVVTGEKEENIYSWPVKKFQSRAAAIRRTMDYLICGIGATQGTKWKNGCPVPSPFFDREKEKSGALISAEEFAGGRGAKAISNPGQKTS